MVLCFDGIFVRNVREMDKGRNVTIRIFKMWKSSKEIPNNTTDSTVTPNLESRVSGNQSDEDHSLDSSEDDSSDEVPREGQEVRQVVQLHCTKWPDFGVPKSTSVMKDLLAEVDLRKQGLEDPIVVHCSAGIGRTGTFVAIHMSLHKHLHGEGINIRDTVKSLRSQRLGMVQSKEQYMFVYTVVADILAWRHEMSLPQNPLNCTYHPTMDVRSYTDRVGIKTSRKTKPKDKKVINKIFDWNPNQGISSSGDIVNSKHSKSTSRLMKSLCDHRLDDKDTTTTSDSCVLLPKDGSVGRDGDRKSMDDGSLNVNSNT